MNGHEFVNVPITLAAGTRDKPMPSERITAEYLKKILANE
jgi:hypothetical protein